ncbi:MAG: hypothetical protein ACRDH0_09930 [Actinomycetota bacterium]
MPPDEARSADHEQLHAVTHIPLSRAPSRHRTRPSRGHPTRAPHNDGRLNPAARRASPIRAEARGIWSHNALGLRCRLAPHHPPGPSSPTISGREAERDAFADRLFRSALGYVDILSIHLGGRLGLYRTLAEVGPTTSPELAERAGMAEQYAREWPEHQATAGADPPIPTRAPLAAGATSWKERAPPRSRPAGSGEASLRRSSPQPRDEPENALSCWGRAPDTRGQGRWTAITRTQNLHRTSRPLPGRPARPRSEPSLPRSWP